MKLAELEPKWITDAKAGGWRVGRATGVADAQGLQMLCPKCFAENGGGRGTHSVIVPFADRGLPADFMPQMPRWAATGTGLEDLSTTPSILLIGGCGWHGFITNGEIITC